MFHCFRQSKDENSLSEAAKKILTCFTEEETVASQHSWNKYSMNQNVRRMQYAVRGPIVMKANLMAAQGRQIYYTNIGNPQATGQRPNTYCRQVMALCNLPRDIGVDNLDMQKIFPTDVIERANSMQALFGKYGTGAYTNSQGVLGVRQEVAKFIEERDGHSSNPENIFLSNGATTAIDLTITSLMSDHFDAIMTPIPQYPIYSALLARVGCRQVDYFLDEENNWSISESELETQYEEAMDESLNIKALVLINPGNPTGQVLSRESLEVICKFCANKGIVLLADEVYQKNVYSSSKNFSSAKKVALETPECEKLQLVSFHSTSKGVLGECGHRGGYMEIHNIDPYVKKQLVKLASSTLCPNISGQIMTSLMVSQPRKGQPSHKQFMTEQDEIFQSLKRPLSIITVRKR